MCVCVCVIDGVRVSYSESFSGIYNKLHAFRAERGDETEGKNSQGRKNEWVLKSAMV